MWVWLVIDCLEGEFAKATILEGQGLYIQL